MSDLLQDLGSDSPEVRTTATALLSAQLGRARCRLIAPVKIIAQCPTPTLEARFRCSYGSVRLASQLGALFGSADPEVRLRARTLIDDSAGQSSAVSSVEKLLRCPQACHNLRFTIRSFKCQPRTWRWFLKGTYECVLNVRKDCGGGDSKSWAEITVEYPDCPGKGSILYCMCEVNPAGVDPKRNTMIARVGLIQWMKQNDLLLRCPKACYRKFGPIQDVGCASKVSPGAICVGQKRDWECKLKRAGARVASGMTVDDDDAASGDGRTTDGGATRGGMNEGQRDDAERSGEGGARAGAVDRAATAMLTPTADMSDRAQDILSSLVGWRPTWSL